MERISQIEVNGNGYESDSELDELYSLPADAVDLATSERHIDNKRKRGGERLPTRRPDPNVYNRNALLARENRKRKKAHVETLENCLEECKRVNIKLLDALKHQRKITRRLEREKLYYKNIVTNRTEIVSLVSALNGRLRETIPTSRCLSLSQTSPAQDSLYSYSGSSSYEPDYPAFAFDSYSDNGIAGDRSRSSTLDFNDSSFLDNFLTELEHPPAVFEDTWNELLHDKNFGLAGELSDVDTNNEILSNVQLEHSYVSSNNKDESTLKEVTGVCLHIGGGKVSLEFCPTCHWSANQAPPKQLLQGDLTESLPKDSTGAQAQLEIYHLKKLRRLRFHFGSCFKCGEFFKKYRSKI